MVRIIVRTIARVRVRRSHLWLCS